MAIVAQCDSKRYYLYPTNDHNQGLPGNCFSIVPLKINRDRIDGDVDGWYNGYHPRVSENWTHWTYVEDHIGKTVYRGMTPIIIVEYGPLPTDVTLEPVLTEEQIQKDLQKLREEQYIKIDEVGVKMWDAGVWYKGYLFQSRQRDRDNVKDVLALVNQIGWFFSTDYTWRSADDIMVPFSYIDLFLLNASLVIQNEIVYNIRWQDKDVKLANMVKKSDIINFVPTYLNTHQMQELINQRLHQFDAVLDQLKQKM